MNIKPLSVHAGLAMLPLMLMGVGVAATCLVAWQVASSEGGASALTWVGLLGIVASVLTAGVVALQGAAAEPQIAAEPDQPSDTDTAAENESLVAEQAEPSLPTEPDTALLEELEALRDQLAVAESSAEERQAALSAAQAHDAAIRESIDQALALLARLRESLGAASTSPVVDAAAAPTAVIANNSREVLDGIDSALAAMQQQAGASAQRLVRVGESASESVELLAELLGYTDQTEILSVNAAIQATLAGETGNGFAVIAEQLQRVSARSADACVRLEALGNLVSNDVGEALSDNKERNAELARSKRLSDDLRTALVELSKSAGTADSVEAGSADNGDVMSLIDEAEEKISTALAAMNRGAGH